MEVESNIEAFEKINRRLKVIFYDGNRTKQSTFKNTKKNSWRKSPGWVTMEFFVCFTITFASWKFVVTSWAGALGRSRVLQLQRRQTFEGRQCGDTARHFYGAVPEALHGETGGDAGQLKMRLVVWGFDFWTAMGAGVCNGDAEGENEANSRGIILRVSCNKISWARLQLRAIWLILARLNEWAVAH